VQDFFEDHGHLHLVMEWVEGIDLATYIRYVVATTQQTRWELITAVGIGLLRGLAAAHEHVSETGEPAIILHRDVSPHNVLISVKGPARLIDFGLAFAADRMMAPTPAGTAKGKLAYLSPEVARGEPPTAASDQFAAGSVLWEALAGRKLFDGADQAAVFRKLATADVTPIDELRSDLPKKLTKIISRALHADPGERFPSVRAMAMALGEVLKTAQSRVDLYELLSRTVVDARITLDMGRRTQAPAFTEAAPVDDSKEAILLPFVSAWRRIRSALPFLGGDTPPRQRPVPGNDRTPTGPRRVDPGQTFHLSRGDEARVGDLLVRCISLDFERTPTEPIARLEVRRDDRTERVALDVPGQATLAGHLVSTLSCERGRLSLRVDQVAAGQSLLVFPHVTVAIGRFYVSVTGVDEHKVFLRLAHEGAAPEHVIVGVSAKRHGVVERAGRRIGVQRVAPPWVVLRVDVTD
jgi:serine/threonine-protein kinase